MGAGASAGNACASAPAAAIKSFPLKKLPEQVEEAVYVLERFCLIQDPEEMACRYLKYQLGSFISVDDVQQMRPEYLNRALVGAMRYGRTITLKFATLENVRKENIFTPGMFPEELLRRDEFLRDEVWQSVLKPELGDPPAEEVSVSSDFCFILCVTQSSFVPPELAECLHVFQISDAAATAAAAAANTNANANAGNADSALDPIGDAVASMFGAQEIVRNSPQLVEAGFDGDLDEVKAWIDKGFHLESTDGRKHTALSEAACQGHEEVVRFLLDQGADPNALSDTGRSALWRAAFSGHVPVCRVLLEAGCSPEWRDKTSMESAFDVARIDEVRDLLGGWDLAQTERLMAARKRLVLAKLEERIQTAAQREEFARQKIRVELVAKAEAGDWDGIHELLLMVAEEAEKASGGRPRASAECRSDSGQSLLSLAAQHDHPELAERLLTHWKVCDKDRWDLPEGELSAEARVFKTNVNARDLRGWNCACIAVFHQSLKTLRVLLDHGADCNMRSQYGKNAHDLAKDELDAAGNVVTSRAEIRAVIVEHDKSGAAGGAGGGALFGTGAGISRETNLYADLDSSGSPVVMQIELAKESAGGAGAGAGAGAGGGGGGKGGGKGGKAGGGGGGGGGGGSGGKAASKGKGKAK